jgi:hypothetical protein
MLNFFPLLATEYIGQLIVINETCETHQQENRFFVFFNWPTPLPRVPASCYIIMKRKYNQ